MTDPSVSNVRGALRAAAARAEAVRTAAQAEAERIRAERDAQHVDQDGTGVQGGK